MIECVNIENCHLFEGNPLYEQHKFRYESIIKRQSWDVPTVRSMEYDNYDNPATQYFIKRDQEGRAVGVSRLYPTDRPYMLQEAFPYLITKMKMPSDRSVWEGSRFCVDSSLSPDDRKRIIQELVIGYLEFSLAHNVNSIIGVMYPVYWKNIFIKSGWNVEWLGDVHKSEEGHKIIAGNLVISQTILKNVRAITGIKETILDYGTAPHHQKRIAA